MGTILMDDADITVRRTNLERFDGVMISRRLKNAFDFAGLKTWADVEALPNIWYLKNVGKKSLAEAETIIKRRHTAEADTVWCEQCERETVGVCPHYEEAKQAVLEDAA